jgi:energy-coupling factor transporter ATP-binding protein EcfA2
MNRMEQFTQAYRHLNLFPLFKPEDIERFRVPYGQRSLRKLHQDIAATEENGKLIFTGHRGCGKSTLLGQLAKRMREEGLFVVGFSIADMVEMSDVNHINILYSIALRLMEKAMEHEEVSIPESIQKKLMNWFTETRSRVYTQQLQEQMSVGANLFNFFTGKLQTEKAFRDEIKESYQNNVSDLARQIDLVAAAIQGATKKPVLVIIDDLDKLDLPVVRSIFEEHINSLYLPNIRVLFTIPIAVIRETGLLATLRSRSQIIQLPVTKFFHRESAHEPGAEPIEENVERLLSVLEKRIPDELIEPEIKREIVMRSGGVLRELMRLAQECCRECMFEMDMNPERTDIKIDAAILKEATKNLRIEYARPLGSNLLDLLAKTYERFSPPDAKSDEFLELLHGLYVLEYENDELWYDLHPLVVDLLRRNQLIGAE